MIVSLNEIEGTVLKAARGAGYSWGLAEEAAAAARWLALWDLPWLANVTAVLSREAAAERNPDAATNPLLVGAACTDRPALHDRDALVLPLIRAPLWLVGVLGNGLAPTPVRLAFAWTATRITIERGIVVSASGTLDAATAEPLRISMLAVPDEELAEWPASKASLPRPGGRHVDDVAWSPLAALEANTYVPASMQSRVAGAGAGLSDND